MKYRKLPVEVEALQWTNNGDEMKKFMGTLIRTFDKGELIIPTLAGDMKAAYGEYIIKGVKGEFYPCEPNIFRSTYEEVK